MIFNMIGSKGEDVLNYKVVGGTSKHANPEAVTVWINTDKEITSHSFSPNRPAAIEGRVWIKVGSTSDAAFNALKKNMIYLYPISAKQYINGVWVDKDMQIYTGSAWTELTALKYIYNIGDQNESFTGGLEIFVRTNMNITFNEANIYWHAIDSSADAEGSIRTKNMIDITGFTKLSFEADFASNTGIYWGISNGATTNYIDFACRSYVSGQDGTGRRIETLDISDYSGDYYINLSCSNSGTVYRMWLE